MVMRYDVEASEIDTQLVVCLLAMDVMADRIQRVERTNAELQLLALVLAAMYPAYDAYDAAPVVTLPALPFVRVTVMVAAPPPSLTA